MSPERDEAASDPVEGNDTIGSETAESDIDATEHGADVAERDAVDDVTTSADDAGSDIEGDVPKQTRGRLRWPVLLLVAAGVVCLGIWQDTPSEQSIEVRVAASAEAKQVQLTWSDESGALLRHSTHHFDGRAAERRIDSKLTAQPGTYRLDVTVVGARTERARAHRIELREGAPVTVFAP